MSGNLSPFVTHSQAAQFLSSPSPQVWLFLEHSGFVKKKKEKRQHCRLLGVKEKKKTDENLSLKAGLKIILKEK